MPLTLKLPVSQLHLRPPLPPPSLSSSPLSPTPTIIISLFRPLSLTHHVLTQSPPTCLGFPPLPVPSFSVHSLSSSSYIYWTDHIHNYRANKTTPTDSVTVISLTEMGSDGDNKERETELTDDENLRCDFIQLLRSRRSGEVPLTVEPAKAVKSPLFQDAIPPTRSEAMESCPKADVENFKELLQEENLYLITEEGEQGRLPLLILSLKEECQEKRPAVVFLHSTSKNKEWLRPLLEAYASRGYIAVGVDSRYHGERASSKTTYRDALLSSWKKGDTMPFIFDTAWDLIKLADYLSQREDIDPSRIGITGESLGGMHAWFAAFADKRYSVVVPIIGVQGFRWAIDSDKWQARVDSIKPVFEEARSDIGKTAIDKEVVEKVWDRIAPGLASDFDSPHTISVIAPRPLLIVNGEQDPRCPVAGLETPMLKVKEAYEKANYPDNFKFIAEPGIRHQMTAYMVKEASDWFDKFLKQ